MVDHGGFEAAAEALKRSQSAVSYSLKRLQEQLPVAVLAPQGRRTQLTDPGQVLLQRARLMLDEARRLEQLAATLAQGWETQVRLAVEIVMPPDPLLGALARFSAEAPQTRVQMIETVLSGTCEALLQHQVDLAITGQVPPGFLGDPLVRVDFVAVARADHPLHALGRTLTLEDLRAQRQIVIRDTGRFRQVDSGWLEAEERWTVSHLLTAIAILKRGLWFCLDPAGAHSRGAGERGTETAAAGAGRHPPRDALSGLCRPGRRRSRDPGTRTVAGRAVGQGEWNNQHILNLRSSRAPRWPRARPSSSRGASRHRRAECSRHPANGHGSARGSARPRPG